MLPAGRRKAILEVLAKKGFVTVAELGQMFSVSEMTVRRDLAALKEEGLLQRTYGGAVGTDLAFFEVSLNAKMGQFTEQKRRIGRAAAEMVRDGDILLLDSGSTTFEVAKHLKDRRVTVVTNALNIASELSDCRQIELLVVGGLFRWGAMSLVGPQAESFLREVRVDKLFLGVEGVDVHGGLTVPDTIEAHTKRAMIRSAKQTIVVADHSKLGRNTLTTIAPLSEASVLITGEEADPEIVERLSRHIDVLTV